MRQYMYLSIALLVSQCAQISSGITKNGPSTINNENILKLTANGPAEIQNNSRVNNLDANGPTNIKSSQVDNLDAKGPIDIKDNSNIGILSASGPTTLKNSFTNKIEQIAGYLYSNNCTGNVWKDIKGNAALYNTNLQELHVNKKNCSNNVTISNNIFQSHGNINTTIIGGFSSNNMIINGTVVNRGDNTQTSDDYSVYAQGCAIPYIIVYTPDNSQAPHKKYMVAIKSPTQPVEVRYQGKTSPDNNIVTTDSPDMVTVINGKKQ